MLDKKYQIENLEFRQARKSDCPEIVSLYSIASDGVADYVWTTMAEAGESIHNVGLRRYQQENTVYSYRNCKIVVIDNKIAGMMVAYEMQVNTDADYTTGDPVLVPYARLEEDKSYYISGMAVFEEYRGNGIGSRLLEVAEDNARSLDLDKLSLIVFEQNVGARSLYERFGYKESMREAVVPHPLIHYTGDALLMVKKLG